MTRADNTKHTPGPWAVHNRATNILALVPVGEQNKSLGANFVSSDAHRARFAKVITILSVAPYRFDGISPEEHAANIRLIAAAPDLLAALKAIVQHMRDDPDAFLCGICVSQLDAAAEAIAKAEGRS